MHPYSLGATINTQHRSRLPTQISLAHTKLTYGTTSMESIFGSLNNICTADLGGCDTAEGDVGQVTTATSLYDGRSLPATANIVLTPSAEFPIGNASDVVNAVVQVAKAAEQCMTESWRDTGATRSGLDGLHSDQQT